MPAIIHLLISVTAGALIGYITNYLAITMLFRPYKKVLFIQGVIPSKIVDFVDRLSEGGKNLADDISQDEESMEYIKKFVKESISELKMPVRVIAALLGTSMALFDTDKYDRIQEHAIELVGTLIKAHLRGVDMRSMEKMVRDTLNKEFIMLEVYGLILGGILGFVTFLINLAV